MRTARNPFLLYTLLAAALFMRAVVPPGWMPDFDRSDVIVARVCNAAYTVTIPLDRKGEQPSGHHQPAPCAFAGLGGDAPLPEAALPLPVSPPAAQQAIATLAPLMLARTARLQPPGRAPPALA